ATAGDRELPSPSSVRPRSRPRPVVPAIRAVHQQTARRAFHLSKRLPGLVPFPINPGESGLGCTSERAVDAATSSARMEECHSNRVLERRMEMGEHRSDQFWPRIRTETTAALYSKRSLNYLHVSCLLGESYRPEVFGWAAATVLCNSPGRPGR